MRTRPGVTREPTRRRAARVGLGLAPLPHARFHSLTLGSEHTKRLRHHGPWATTLRLDAELLLDLVEDRASARVRGRERGGR